MSDTTRTELEYSIVLKYGEYANKFANSLMLRDVKESELRLFKIATICVESLRFYFKRYDSDTEPTDDNNGLSKSEIENILQILNLILETNFWYEFPTED